MRISFRFRLFPALVCATLLLLGLSLARWQWNKANLREAQTHQMQVRQLQPASDAVSFGMTLPDMYTPVFAEGEWLPEWIVYLDNRPHGGVSGRIVLMPMRLKNSGNVVLIARGWQARDPQDRLRLTLPPTPPGVVKVSGVVRHQLDRVLQLGDAPALKGGALLQNLDTGMFRQASGLPVLPWILQQTSEAQDGLLLQWSTAASGAERNRAYAWQWLALSLLSLIFFAIFTIRIHEPTIEHEQSGN